MEPSYTKKKKILTECLITKLCKLMSNQVLVQSTKIEEKFLLKANKKFNILPAASITEIENTPMSVQYSTVQHQTGGGSNFSFQQQMVETNFLDRGVIMKTSIPITLTLAADSTNDITVGTYVTECGHFKDIALRQHGLAAGIDSLTLNLNGQAVGSVQRVAECLEMSSEYYPLDTMMKHMPASQPDRFYDFAHYRGAGIGVIGTKNEDSAAMDITISAIAEEDIFAGGYSNSYASRKVTFAYDGLNPGEVVSKNKVNLRATLWCYIPFSLFSISTSPFSLYGMHQFELMGSFKGNFVKQLFVTRSNFFSDISFNSAKSSQHTTKLLMKIYKAPEYVTRAMCNPDGTVKPYRIGHSSVVYQPTTPASGGRAQTNQISTGTLPKSVYLSVHAIRDATNPTKTPNFKARIKAINASVGASEVSIGPDALQIFEIARSNGLAKDYESAMYTNGAVIRLDLSKDLSTGAGLIGSNVSNPLTFTVEYDDLTPAASATQYELRCMLAYSSQVLYQDRTFKQIQSLILGNTSFDIANQAASLYGELTPELMTIGAGFFGDLWSGIKSVASRGFNWVKENPEEALGLARKALKLATGAGHQPYNVVGGSVVETLGAGDDSLFK